MSSTQHASPVTFDLDSLQALRFSRPRDMLSVQRFAQRFSYDLARIEELSGVKPGLARDNPFHARVQHFMRVALDVVAWRMLTVPDLDGAIEWFKTATLTEHGNRTPEDIVAAGEQRLLLRADAAVRHN